MRRSAIACEDAMSEAAIGLAVAIGLGTYLVYTLIRPEKF